MRIVTNPGSNIPPELVRAYDIALAPQKISVDGVEHDTRDGVTVQQVNEWVKTAKVYPFVLGSSAAELVDVFRRCNDAEVVAVMSSRHIVGTYTAAVSAARVLKGKVDARIIDSGVTDIGAGLATLLAAQAARTGRSQAEVVSIVEAFCARSTFALVPDTLEWFVKTGRATALKAFFANLMSLRPIIAFVDGELRGIGSVKRDDDSTFEALVGHAVDKLGAGRPAWIGITHGAVPDRARRLEALARKRLDVRYCINREMHASVYHSCGPGVLALFAAAADGLPDGCTPLGR